MKKIPKYCLHKSSGRAVVRLCGKDRYLGIYGTPESRQEYDRVIAEWLANNRFIPADSSSDLSVNEVFAAYWPYATARFEQRHRRNPKASKGQLARIKYAMAAARELYGPTPAAKFGPIALKAVRAKMVGLGWARGYINSSVGCLKTIFAWAVSEEMIPSSVIEGLRCVRGLEAGEPVGDVTPSDKRKVKPVPEAWIEMVRKKVSARTRDLIDLQLLTGARPTELLILRPCDVERSGTVWLYRPCHHKTEHAGERKILLGPKAQEILAPYLLRPADAYCFPSVAGGPPLLANGYYHALVYAVRLSCPSCSQEKRTQRRKITECSWCQERRWSPYRLRHNAATRLRKEFGIEVARIVLGHSTAFTTEIYAEVDHEKAAEAMAKVG